MPPSLSALLIAKDEERDLPGCLESLRGLADEIVVVVSDDTADRTEEIALAAGARVLRRAFDGYAKQRQAGLDAAGGRWCLWIDPDERISPGLAQEILGVLRADGPAAGYELPFEVLFLGRVLRWGGLGRERHLRLFRRGAGRFRGGPLHEGLLIEGPVGRLRARVLHEPYKDLSDYLGKLDRYTTLAAQKRRGEGRRFSALDHLRLPGEFLLRAVLRLGFLDGRPGLVWAGLAAFHSWLKYAKLGLAAPEEGGGGNMAESRHDR